MGPIIFCNIAWMKNYRGIRGDKPRGGGSYVTEYGTGSERHNFNPILGWMRGFVQVNGAINLERLGAAANVPQLEGVTVVWVAPSPLGGSFIIGWYLNATLFRDLRIDGRVSNRDYRVVAKAKDCVLLPIDRRTFPIPRKGKGAMGQSNIWYADKQKPQFISQVKAYIRSQGVILPRALRRLGSRSSYRSHDPLRMQRVEEAAIRRITKHYSKLGYIVTSVERDNVGWDLEAYLHKRSFLRLEVKGLSGSQVTVELTPNEFRNMERNRDSYRLCVVSNALVQPKVYVFAYSPDRNRWEDSVGNALQIQRIVGARMHLV